MCEYLVVLVIISNETVLGQDFFKGCISVALDCAT